MFCLYCIHYISACQLRIGGIRGLDCKSCIVNGDGKCDTDGCPKNSVFVETKKQCAGKVQKINNACMFKGTDPLK